MSEVKTMEGLLLLAQEKSEAHKKSKEIHVKIEGKSAENVAPANNAEWYSEDGVKNDILDLTYKNDSAMSLFQAGLQTNSGSLPDSYPVPYNITSQKMKSKTVWVDEGRPGFDNKALTSAKGTITQKPLILQAGVPDEMIDTALDKDILAFVKNELVKSAQRTMLDMFINGDIEAGATGNVNSDDQLPATTFADGAADCTLLLDGLRADAIANSNTYDVSALDLDDTIAVRKLLGNRYSNDLKNLATLWNVDTWLTALTDDAIKLAINTSQQAGIDGGQPLPFGGMHATSDLVRLTEADGKESGATPSNNVKGQFITFYMPAVVHGFGKGFMLEVERVQGYGFEITATMKWGFDIVDAANTVAIGRDVTV